ncbi:TonB-dependent receptor [Dysgonomonas sp. BGC7]|uniref:TonB-dependent receptor n=1 Tax=Dysgonomonas sp. BGC7 TaxID=1658008 RepID=UPI0006812433|nr:TonB-dependent receptor [Dysgonomonas sp. BGC7]MBD8387151.1 TonB-dependent receptor [Dysgonomonas sp. BGC7]
MRKIYLLLLFLVINISFIAAQTIKGKVLDEKGQPLVSATVVIKELNRGVSTDSEGKFRFVRLPKRELTVEVGFVGYDNNVKKINFDTEEEVHLLFNMVTNTYLEEVEVFGERYKQPEKLDAITRMPLRPSEQIQSISVISDKVISEQGALTITDAVRNVPGVTLFGSYGGVRESMSSRGYRGVPVLKNGVRIDSDFRTGSITSDMQGVESIQVIKGSAAVTQGVGNDLGSPGGVINVVTKTPKFVNGGEVSIRTGSWGQFRPTFDVQSVLDKGKTVAFRLNGAYERSDGFRKHVSMNRVYINPSLEWRPDSKTTVTLEMDYMDENKTPDRGTINLAGPDTEALYKMPLNQFLGFNTDNTSNKTSTYAARIVRQIADKVSIRAAYFNSSYNSDQTGAALDTIKGGYSNPERQRSLNRSLREDKNSTFQLDLIGRDIFTGSIKHTFQLGFDYKKNDLMTNSYGYLNAKGKFVTPIIDTINATSGNINNGAPKIPNGQWNLGDPVISQESSYGIMAQEVMTINQYLKAILGLRYSYQTSTSGTGSGQTTGDAWDPIIGVMITPIKNINLFGSYTTTTSLRSAAQLKEDGSAIGASRSKQYEVGIKSDWLDNRLRFNFTYFNILNSNTSYGIYSTVNDRTPLYYDNAGDLKRDGIEVELSGRILENLQIMTGYAYVNPRYKNSPAYKEGSAPINTAKHTANGWLNYLINKGPLKGLSAGLGVYYVGDRPSNDYTITVAIHNTQPNVKPFDMPAYTTVNAQLAYTYSKFTARVFFNNIFDEVGYNSYFRGGYINQIDPRNFAAVVSYKF